MKIDFKPSTSVTELKTGKVRDDSFDAPVSAAYAESGKVFETTISNEDVDAYRRGLQRSALYLQVRVATDFEEITPDGEDGKGNVKYGKTIVRFAAFDKQARKPRNVETADAPAADVENATV